VNPKIRRIFPIVLVLAALAALSYWYFEVRPGQATNGTLTASGTISITQVEIGTELGGQVVEVLAEEGQAVQSGQILVRFDDRLLRAQQEQAQEALALAQANYDLVAAGTSPEQRQAAIAAAQLEVENARQALKTLQDNASMTQATAQQAIADAKKLVDSASRHVASLEGGSSKADIDSAWATVVLARHELENAMDDFEPYENKPEDNLTRAALLNKLSAAQTRYDNAVTRYNNLIGTANKLDLDQATANLVVAQAQLTDAERKYAELQNGIDPEAQALAESRLATAEAHLAAARADPSQEQLEVAKKQVDAAQAAVDALQVQMEKLIVTAPVDGVVLTQVIQPGEIALTSATLLVLGLEDDKTITVYIPEERYGAISMGQKAAVSVDSFPGASFDATVVNIADQAEFTPRNVQTVEGRKNTVFAIKLKVDDPEDKLKAGMPADVMFQ
jgi:HlyD family secretion protein